MKLNRSIVAPELKLMNLLKSFAVISNRKILSTNSSSRLIAKFLRTNSCSFSTNPSNSNPRKFDFNSVSEDSLNGLLEKLEAKEAHLPNTFDAEYSQGVLTIKFDSKIVYVLNKQPPNQQIWLSSPFTGPKRFEWKESDSTWRDVRNSETELIEFLRSEFANNLKFEL